MTACLQNVLGCESQVNLSGFLLYSLKNSWQKLFGNVIYQRQMKQSGKCLHVPH